MTQLKLKPWQPKETLIQSAILEAMFFEQAQGRVSWCERMNSGATKYVDKNGRKRFVRFGFPGCPDIIGMLSDGTSLYFEVKGQKGRVTEAQKRFMDKVLRDGGVGGIVRSADEAVQIVRDYYARKK